ncbi:MAG: hypothetical protein ACKOE9_09400 [Vulcanococcus sp.]
MNTITTTMNRFKKALGLPESVGLFGLFRVCPLLMVLVLLALTAGAVVLLN